MLRQLIPLLLVIIPLMFPHPSQAQVVPNPNPVNLIIDSDIASDLNDALVFATVNALVQQGEAKVLAVVTNVNNIYSAPLVRTLNAWWGHPLTKIPVGAYQGDNPNLIRNSPFAQIVVDQWGIPGDTRANYPSSLTIYRHTLAKAKDHDVVILSVGFLNNLSELLQSPADTLSPLNGMELVNQKVKQLVLMGGEYPHSQPNQPEHNFKIDPTSAAYVMEHWPSNIDIVTTGFTLGVTVCTRPSASRDPATDPFAKIWSTDPNNWICPFPGYGTQVPGTRPSWDTLTTLFAVRGLADYFNFAGINGTNTIDSEGGNVWENPGTGNVTYLGKVMSDEDLARELNSLADITPAPVAPPPTPLPNPACQIDTRVYSSDPSLNQKVDRVTIGNIQYTRLESAGWSKNQISDFPHYSQDPNAPCYQISPDQCRFTTRTAYTDNNGTLKESITIGSNYYDWSGTSWVAVSNHDLASVARYRTNTDAPCHNSSPGGCTFSSRTVLYRPGSANYDEYITIGPKLYHYDRANAAWESMANHDLAQIPHYTEPKAPCYNLAPESCHFTSLMRYYNTQGVLSEFVTVNDRYFDWTEGVGWWTKTENRLGYTARFLEANGPCSLVPKPGDINNSQYVDHLDLSMFLPAYNSTQCNSIADLNHDCSVNIFDFNILSNFFGN